MSAVVPIMLMTATDSNRKPGCKGPMLEDSPCTEPVLWVSAVADDPHYKRHMALCEAHDALLAEQHPEFYAGRLKLSITEWQDYCMQTYGRLPKFCTAVCCRVEGS